MHPTWRRQLFRHAEHVQAQLGYSAIYSQNPLKYLSRARWRAFNHFPGWVIANIDVNVSDFNVCRTTMIFYRFPDYEVAGDADTTIYLLHGAYGSKRHFRHEIQTLVRAGHRVVAWDAPGYGISSLPEGRPQH